MLSTVNAKTGEKIFMNTTNKLNRVLMAATAVLAMATSAFAIPKGPCDVKPQPDVCCEEPAPGPFAFSYAKDMSLSCPSDFYIRADFLLMQAKEDGLEYAVTQNEDFAANLNQLPLDEGEIQGFTSDDHSTDWNFGARVAIGFYLNHDAWDLRAQYTYFRINNDKGTIVKNQVLLPFWSDPAVGVPVDAKQTSARWTGTIHDLNLTLGKPYHVSRYVILSPNVGVKFAKIDQDFKVRNSGTWPVTPSTQRIDMVIDNDFWGVGAMVAMESEWIFGAGFSMFANASASLLYSHFDIKESLFVTVDNDNRVDHEFNTVTPNANICIGLAWCKHFSKNRYAFTLKGAYEFQAWYDQNRMRRFLDTNGTIGALNGNPASNIECPRANLYLNGFVFGVGFDF